MTDCASFYMHFCSCTLCGFPKDLGGVIGRNNMIQECPRTVTCCKYWILNDFDRKFHYRINYKCYFY